MELRDYLRIARRRWRLILGCLLTAVAVASLVTYNMTPQYSSTARLFISTAQSDSAQAYQGSLFSAQRVTSYADLATGRELASRVIKRLDLHTDPGTLAKKVSATVTPETVILQVSVTDPSPVRAQRLTQAYAEELTGFVSDLETPPGKKRAPIKATIVDAAAVPQTPVSPQPLRNIGLAAVLGLLLGLGAAVLRELLDTSVKTNEDVTEAAGAPVMGSIAFDPQTTKRPLVTSLDSHAPRVEAFRVLRTNMQFVDIDTANKAVVVTSSVPQEGKTTTALNLAITLAQAGQRVLLMDADLRRPKVADNLRLEPTVGLTTVLVGRVELHEAVQPYTVEGLDVLASGAIPPNPAELLQSNAMADLMVRVRKEYDVVVVDAPPLLPVTDAALITAQGDGALLVVRHGKTTKDQLRHAIDRLEHVGARPLGVVLNMIPSRRLGDPYYGYGYGYGYGYAPESGRRRGETERKSSSARTRRPEGTLEDLGFSRD